MKKQILLACALLFVPIFGMAARVQSGQNGGSIPVYTSHFTFTLFVDAQGNGISPVFSNRTGGFITSVTITPQLGAYTTNGLNDCTITVYFSGCTSPEGDGGDWFFFGPPGIPPAGAIPGSGEFDFAFFGFNPSPPGGWTINGDLTTTVPEPTTLLLLGPALAGLWMKRKAFLRS